MLHERERWILFSDITLKPSPEEAPFMRMDKSIDYLLRRQQADEAFKLLDNNTAAIRITDMRLDIKKHIEPLVVTLTPENIENEQLVVR